MIDVVQITAPAFPAVSLVELKEHLRIDHEDEDFLLESYIAAATRHFEWRTGRTVHETEWEVAFDGFPYEYCIRLPYSYPLISITSIKYMNSVGVDTTWPTSSYIVDTHGRRIAPAYGISWPSFTPYPLSAVRIRYKAGQAVTSPPSEAEEGIRHCILEMVGAMYENREYITATDRSTVAAYAENPVTKALLSQYKVNHAY